MGPLLAVLLLAAAPQAADPTAHYRRGLELWREGRADEALRHFMTATRDPEAGFYAMRQIAAMGRYALPVLYRALWHEDGRIARAAAIAIAWIGAPESVEPLLFRLRHPEAPVEIEYALRTIGGVRAADLLALLDEADFARPALFDRKASDFARLTDGLGLAVDPVPVVRLVERLDATRAAELAEDPFGHLAAGRLKLLLWLARRGVRAAAPLLVAQLHPEGGAANGLVADALVALGPAAAAPLEGRFAETRAPELRALLAVAHYFALGAGELASSGPLRIVLNELSRSRSLAVATARWAGRLAREPNALVEWFRHHPDPSVRAALAPVDVERAELARRRALLPFFLEKAEDPDPSVAEAHLGVALAFLPEPSVEALVARLLADPYRQRPLRERALDAALDAGLVAPVAALVGRRGDPLRAEAIRRAARRPEAPLVRAVLAVLDEDESSEARRAAILVAAERWRRPEAGPALEGLLRAGAPEWIEAARGLAALGVAEALEPFVGWIDAGRPIDPDTAEVVYFALTGTPARLVADGPGTARFEPADLAGRPGDGGVLVLLTERSDLRGWVKVEELWEGRRRFRLDEERGELVLYDRDLFDRVRRGASVVLLEETVRQSVLTPLELTETRSQSVRVVEALPVYPFAGLDGDGVRVAREGRWLRVAFGRDLRLEDEAGRWGRAATVPLRPFPRDRIRFSEEPLPSGWPRGEGQPVP